MTGLRWAFGFLTVLPVRPKGELAPGDLGRAANWYPLVGLAIGAVLWAAEALLARIAPPLLAGTLIVVLWAAMTGGLHLDGLADCCDGLLVAAAPARRREILKEVHIGAFGVTGIVLLLLVKAAAAGWLTDPIALLLAPAAARWIVLPMASRRPAASDGLGARLHAELGSGFWLWLLPLAAAALAVGLRGAAALLGALLVAWGLGALARNRLGGHTGDVLGAAVELAESAVLLAFALGPQL